MSVGHLFCTDAGSSLAGDYIVIISVQDSRYLHREYNLQRDMHRESLPLWVFRLPS